MVLKEAVKTTNAPPPMPFFSQAIKCNGMVYCSGSVGMDPRSMKLVEGSVGDRAEQCLKNLAAVLEAAGSR
ncbi:RutC family protein [Lachnellula suecica]|uniref:RutC family protein n=1 Tax=Lachnellula suecica TaxID=602035 RepID=A0A8T9BS38_9HELO|nr:RutC family protein [Lachnellula suecica]